MLALISPSANQEDYIDKIALLIKALLERVGYNELKILLREQGLSLRNSFDKYIYALAYKLAEPKNWGKLEALWQEYHENTNFGEKAVKFYKISPQLMPLVQKAFASYKIEECHLSKAYPLPIADELMPTLDKKTRIIPKPIYFNSEINGMVFGSIRFFSKQEKYSIAQVTNRPRLVEDVAHATNLKSLQGYDEIILKKHSLKQFFDLIILHPSECLIQVIVDSPDTQNQSQTQQQIKDSFEYLYDWLASLVHNLISKDDLFPAHPINLLPAILPLCRAHGDGLLRMYKFVTSSALEDQPTARATERDKDLRNDEILKKGEETALSKGITIEIYKAAFAWPQHHRVIPMGHGEKPYIPFLELALLGTKPRTKKGYRFLEYATIKGSRSFADYQFLCRKLFTYLSHDY